MSLFFIVHLLTPHYNTPNTQFAKDFLNDKETSSGNTTVACHVLMRKSRKALKSSRFKAFCGFRDGDNGAKTAQSKLP